MPNPPMEEDDKMQDSPSTSANAVLPMPAGEHVLAALQDLRGHVTRAATTSARGTGCDRVLLRVAPPFQKSAVIITDKTIYVPRQLERSKCCGASRLQLRGVLGAARGLRARARDGARRHRDDPRRAAAQVVRRLLPARPAWSRSGSVVHRLRHRLGEALGRAPPAAQRPTSCLRAPSGSSAGARQRQRHGAQDSGPRERRPSRHGGAPGETASSSACGGPQTDARATATAVAVWR